MFQGADRNLLRRMCANVIKIIQQKYKGEHAGELDLLRVSPPKNDRVAFVSTDLPSQIITAMAPVKSVPMLVKAVLMSVRQRRHPCCCRESDKCNQQRVLDQVLALFVLQQSAIHYRRFDQVNLS